MIFTVSTMQFLAPGWGLMTMALPAFRAMMLLYMAVEVGLVEGTERCIEEKVTAELRRQGGYFLEGCFCTWPWRWDWWRG